MANPFQYISAAYQSLKTTATEWFTPDKPIEPSAPPGTQPRTFEYPAGYNLNTLPRAYEEIDFGMLRNLADNCDLLRVGIETCKDQVESLEWGIGPKKKLNMKPADLRAATQKQQANIDKAYALLTYPDLVNGLSWKRWIRKVMEDMIILDAPSIEVIRTRGGDIARLKVVDGATIIPKIDINGDRPQTPDPAYQQVLYGMPAINLTTDQLLYLPRNPRANHVYGYSYVEQIVTTVDIAIRRQLYMLGFFTEGNIPETAFGCPEGWTAEQVAEFQAYWDSLFEGDQNAKRKGRFIPGGITPFQLKSPELKAEVDEWLARVIMYVLSLPPTPFTKETNRATAETVQQASKSEGLAPRKNYVKELMDTIIQRYMGFTEIEFQWIDEDAIAPLEKAQVNQIYLQAKVLDPDEVREELGRDPLTPEQQAKLNPPVPEPFNGQKDDKRKPEQEEQDPKKGKATDDPDDVGKIDTGGGIAKKAIKKKPFEPISRETDVLNNSQSEIEELLQEFFKERAPEVAGTIVVSLKAGKLIDQILDELDFDGWSILFDDVQPLLMRIAKYSGARALAQVEVSDENITNLVNEDAVAWANERAAEMVGKKWVDGELVDNHNANWAITESTREYLRETVTNAMEEGWSPQKLAKKIEDNTAFSESRAKMIARTETALADCNGRMIGYKQSGLNLGKHWIVADGDDECDDCANNEAAGVIGLDDDFPSGDAMPPCHPNCRCDYTVALLEDEEDDQVTKFSESDHPRDEKGRFTVKDEYIDQPKSLGARAANCFTTKKDIPLAGKGNPVLEAGSKVTKVKVISEGTKIRDVRRLVNDHKLPNGADTRAKDWKKMTGTATIKTDNGPEIAEIHWYQCENIGKIEMKVKQR